MSRPPPRDEQGAVILWSLGLLLMLFFAGGMALDLWRVLSQHGTLSGLAYQSAVAGAAEVVPSHLYQNRLVLDPSLAEQSARRFALDQPEWSSSMTMSVTADPTEIVVVLTDRIPLTLMASFTPKSALTVTVTARATAAEFR
ncbi:MAG: hypothetical protein F4Y75_06570 [Acidimicrobiia bacterium]|nr:hypothetical protein [bacterium]MCY3653145.1 hypothetical protein [bacterium]MXZ07155.1 hypothetical protein [Acidimicrobiia bacterium]